MDFEVDRSGHGVLQVVSTECGVRRVAYIVEYGCLNPRRDAVGAQVGRQRASRPVEWGVEPTGCSGHWDGRQVRITCAEVGALGWLTRQASTSPRAS